MYELYFAPDNASLVVRIVLEELGAPYRAVLVDRAAREHEGEAYRRLNPAGLIPVCVVDGEPVFETAAIALLLAERHGALAPPPGEPARPSFLKWFFFVANTLHAHLRLMFYPHLSGVDDPTARGAFTARQRKRAEAHFAILDGAYTGGDGPWLLGSRLSIVDIYAALCWRWARLYPAGAALDLPPTTLPGLARAAARLDARPAAARAAAAEGIRLPLLLDPAPPDGSMGSPT